MTPGEFKKFVRTMKESGVSHLKMGDCEITLGASHASEPAKFDPDKFDPGSIPDYLKPQRESEPEKVDLVQSLIKMDDMELINRLFPEPTPMDESV